MIVFTKGLTLLATQLRILPTFLRDATCRFKPLYLSDNGHIFEEALQSVE